MEVQGVQTDSGGAEGIRAAAAEPAQVVIKFNTTNEKENMDDLHQDDKPLEYDDKLNELTAQLPADKDEVSEDELPDLISPNKDIGNQEMDPHNKGSERKISINEKYDLATFADETAPEANLLEVKNIPDDHTPAPPVHLGVNILEIEEVSDEELPEPKRAQPPAAAEEVSDDELLVPEHSDLDAKEGEMDPQRKNSDRALSYSEDGEIKEGNVSSFEIGNVPNDNLSAPSVLSEFNNHETGEVSDEELPELKHAKLPADTEVVFEDELSVPEQPDNKEEVMNIPEIEDVSDGELPEAERAQLPAGTENVSEDELPDPKHHKTDVEDGEVKPERKQSKRKLPASVCEIRKEADDNPVPSVLNMPETEEVSDEELPEPKRAKLPDDTEVVSEDELPAPKHPEKDVENGEIEPQKRGSKRKPSINEDNEIKKGDGRKIKHKKLPELDKYWKIVNKDSTDFTAWSYLLQLIDQENDVKAAREAYDAFLSHYPYCYGYWRRYADYEKNKGNKKKCEEVLERGLKAIPLSVDLWIHYLSYVKNSKEKDEEYLRLQFERALNACSLDFRSDPLWEFYIKWEFEGKQLQKVTEIFDRLLATPTLGYTSHFDNFQEHVASNAPNQILDETEFMALRAEVRKLVKTKDNLVEIADLPPGDEDSKYYTTEKESKAMKERIVSIRRKVYINTVNSVKARWEFEQGIKRPYFHVKPLERTQLNNWQKYLEYEIQQGDKLRIIVLFERCLIACALYEDFWLMYVSFLEGLQDADMQKNIRDLYERACKIHQLKNPTLHFKWANFEESCADFNRAAEILVSFETLVPDLLQVAYSRINLERRRGNFDKCTDLFEHYIAHFKNKVYSSNMSVKYSRFCLRMLRDNGKAQYVLKSAIAKDPDNPRLYLMLIDLILQKEEVREEEVLNIFNEFLEKESVDLDQKTLFAQRKLQFIEDFGGNVQLVEPAREQLKKLQKLAPLSSNIKSINSESSNKIKKKECPSTLQWPSYNDNNVNSSWNNQPWYNYYGSQQGEYIDTPYAQGNQYQYQPQNWQPPQDKFTGYNQWTGY